MPWNEWDVQKSVMTRLKDADIVIFDRVPTKEEGVARPYSTMGPFDTVPLRSLGTRGGRETLVIHHWGNEREGNVVHGNRQILELATLTRAELDGKPLVLEDGTNLSLRWLQTALVPDPEPNVRHATTRYRIDLR